IDHAADKARGEAQAERIALKERLDARETQSQDLNRSLEIMKEKLGGLQSELNTESQKRAAAEEKNTRIPELQSQMGEKDRQLSALSAEVTHLKTAQAELNMLIDKERKTAEEK